MLTYENQLYSKYPIIAGVDEVGRGCCAGPLVVASVILPHDFNHELIKDSKKLNLKQRFEAFELIQKRAIEISISIINNEDVDKLNPKQASRLGMKLSVEKFKNKPDLVITDFEKIDIEIEQINLVKGDSVSKNVAAASIIAKVTRDNIMYKEALKYPQYDFQNNVGYATKKHQEALETYGITPIHRLSYKNVQKVIKK